MGYFPTPSLLAPSGLTSGHGWLWATAQRMEQTRLGAVCEGNRSIIGSYGDIITDECWLECPTILKR